MREWLRFHSATVGAFLALVVVAAALSLAMPVPHALAESGSPLPVDAIALPGPGEDADRDSFADVVDRAEGDLQVAVRLTGLEVPGDDAAPYVLVGTQDDHWRTGRGAELEWTHVVDPDALGLRAGSPAWQDDVLRTGAWWMSRPGDGLELAVAEASRLTADGAPGVHWPQAIWANVRDDRGVVNVTVELRDAATHPHARRGDWTVEVDLDRGRARASAVHGDWTALPANLTLADGASRLEVQVAVSGGPSLADREAIARRWAPTLQFDSEEAFAPVKGDLLERFHGFTRLPPGDVDLRTWDLGFNGGRDQYRLFLADFDGDRVTGPGDARLMADLLAEGPLGAPTVYAHVGVTTDDQVVVQYWLFYFYNFVLGGSGQDVASLRHKGDREFLQATFPSLEAARNGTPSAVAFSQHYEGLRVVAGEDAPIPWTDGLVDYVARGSHANYPAPGDDRRLRSALTSIFDRFDGAGRVVDPGNYTLELLGDQAWHAGYKWGPATRYTRDLGTSARPLLQHDFRYPFQDPVWWQEGLRTVTPDAFDGMYGVAP